MKKNLAILLLMCLSAVTSWAGSTNDAVENLNRKLPLDSSADRLLSKMIYDEVNNTVIANYYTSWQNLVKMRKTPDFSKRAGEEVLENIFTEDSAVKPFTLIVNYFADEAGFEDLAKTYFISPGEVASAQKAFQKNGKKSNGKKKEQSPVQQPIPESVTAQTLTLEQQLELLESRLAEFTGFTEPEGRFQLLNFALSKDKKDINIIVVAQEDILPFFTNPKYTSTMESSMNVRLAREFPDLENIFNTLDLNVAVYTADPKGQIRGRYKYPASHVFGNLDGEASDQANPGVSNKDNTQTETSSLQQASQPEAQASTQPDVSGQPNQSQSSQTNSKQNAAAEEMLQSLLKLSQAMLPLRIEDGVNLIQIKTNEDNLILLVGVDGEKYPESALPQVREALIKQLSREYGNKKSPFPLLLTLACQSSRHFTYVIASKSWKETYQMPLDPCNLLNKLQNKADK